MKQIEIYTDGACSNNPGPGGWGAMLISGKTIKEISGFCEQTTNNRMELQAVIEGLALIKEPCEIKLYSDSAYALNAFLENWIDKWQKKNWRNSEGKQVANMDQWKRLLELIKPHKMMWIKVKGHSDNKYNNRCDELARDAITKNIKKD